MELLLNESFGGFNISEKAYHMLAERKHAKYAEIRHGNITEYRADKDLIDIFKELGPETNNMFSDLHLVKIPDGSHYAVEDNDGAEQLYYSPSEIRRLLY